MKYQQEPSCNAVTAGSPRLLLQVSKSSLHGGHIQYAGTRYTTQQGRCQWCYVVPIAGFITILIKFNVGTIIDGFVRNDYEVYSTQHGREYCKQLVK